MRMETPLPFVLIATLLAVALAFPQMGQKLDITHSAKDDNVVVGQPLTINGYMSAEKTDDFLEVPGHTSPVIRKGAYDSVGSLQELEPSLEKALVDSDNKFHVGDVQFQDDPLSEAQVVVSGRAQDFEKAFKQLGYFETQEQEAEKQDEEVLEASDIETEPDSIVPEAVKPPVTISTIQSAYTPSDPIADGFDTADGETTDPTVETEADDVQDPGADVEAAQEAGAAETPTESPTAADATSAPTPVTSAPTEAAAEAEATSAPTEAATEAATEAESSTPAVTEDESDDSKEESAAGHGHHMSIMTVAAALVAVAMVN
jgi:hypothetical protein